MLRKCVVILAMLLSGMATQVFALGLGNASVESALNQPLRVRIEILQLGDTRLEDVVVQLASADDFQRFNVSRVGFLSNIRFSYESNAAGNWVVLTTNQIVREPYLSLILETRWPSGRLLSEHTILLDLPVFSDDSSSQTTANVVRQPVSPVLQPQPTPAQEPAVAPAVTAPQSTVPAMVDPEPAPAVAEEPVAAESEAEPEQIAEPVEAAPEAEQEPAPEVQQESVQQESEPQPESEPAPAEAVTAAEESEPVLEVEQEAEQEAEPETGQEAEQEVAVAEEAEPEAAQEQPAVDAASEPEPEQATVDTEANDTLTEIALQVRPNNSVSVQQTMIAIQRLNPDAFAGDNINRMLSGQVLRVPTLAEVQAVTAQEAITEVNRQNQEFVNTQPLAAPAQVDDDQGAEPQAQLSVVAQDDDASGSSNAAGSDVSELNELDARIAELENQLALQQEEADRARLERENLDRQLADLEEQISAAQEIIRLQDLQLAQLQEAMAEAAAQAEAEAAAQQAAANQQVTQPAQQGGGLMADLMRILTGNTMLMIFAAVLVILLLVVLLLRRNNASKLAAEEDELDELAEQEFDAAAREKTDIGSDSTSDFDEQDLDSELDDILGVSSAAAQDDDNESVEEDDLDLEDDLDDASDEPEITTRADALIADRQFDAAATLLKGALAQDDDPQLRLKYAEVLARKGDLLAFEEQADLLQDGELEGDVQDLRKLFAADEENNLENSGSEEDDSFLDDLGIDLDAFDDDNEFDLPDDSELAAETPSTQETTERETPAATADDDDAEELDFDLGDESADEAEIDTGTSADEQDESAIDPDSSPIDNTADDADEALETGTDDSEDESESAGEALEFSVDDDEPELAGGDSKDADDLEIESFEFSVDDSDSDETTDEEQPEAVGADSEIETFSFDIDDSPEPESEEQAQDSPANANDETAVDFEFDKSELDEPGADDEKVEDLETFDFDLEDTVIEKPDDEGADAADEAEPDVDDFDFDLDQLEVDSANAIAPETSSDDSDDLDEDDDDSDDEEISFSLEEDDDGGEETDFEVIDDDSADDAGSASEVEVLEDLEDLGFLSDADEVATDQAQAASSSEAMTDVDEVATKLELAYAYQKMGDREGAEEILREVISEGSDEQVKEAEKLLGSLDDL